MDSVENERGEPDAAENEVVTQSDDNVLLQEFTARASGYFEDTGVTESESDITKRLKLTLNIRILSKQVQLLFVKEWG